MRQRQRFNRQTKQYQCPNCHHAITRWAQQCPVCEALLTGGGVLGWGLHLSLPAKLLIVIVIVILLRAIGVGEVSVNR